MLQLERRRNTDASGKSAASASQLTLFVLRKSKTSFNIVHPLHAAEANADRALFPHHDTPWIPRSLESLTGVSDSLRSLDQAVQVPGSRMRSSIRRLFTDSNARKEYRQRWRSDVWLQALQSLSVLLLNTCLCTACACLANWLHAAGNVFSGRSIAEQSNVEFITATTVFGHWNFYWINLVVHTQVLMTMQFVVLQDAKDPRASFLFCLRRLLSRTYRIYLLSALLLIAAIDLCRNASAAVKRWRLEFYVATVLIHVYTTGTTIAVHGIFKEETVQGQRHYPRRFSPSIWASAVLLVKVYVRSSAKSVVVVFAGLYVQLASRYTITGSWDFAAYTLGSLALKITIKKVTKAGVMKLNVKDPRSIFAAVGLPTVIIDTQVRVMLQRGQSVNFTILWTVGMAVFEIATRLTTVVFTKRQLRHKEAAIRAASSAVILPRGTATTPTSASSTRIASVVVPPVESDATAPRGATSVAEFERWKRQVLAFQIAESYANMSAEYIAIGCSTSILYFYWDHPKYELRGGHAGSLNQSASSASWLRGYTICGQVAAEIFVDFISCVLEISQGVDSQAVQKHRRFLGLLFTNIAVINIQICALMYFHGE